MPCHPQLAYQEERIKVFQRLSIKFKTNILGSGTALLLELARMLSIVYEDDSTRPKITVLFAILPADGFNYITTQDWLGQLEDKAEENKVCYIFTLT